MRASLYTLPADASWQILPGYVVIGTDATGAAIIHAAPGMSAPALPHRAEGATLIKDGLGADRRWKWTDLKVTHPALADYCLRARWGTGKQDAEGRPIVELGTRARGLALGRIPTPIEDDLPPHYWLGDEA